MEIKTLKYQDWIVEDGMLYKYCIDPLLDPMKSGQEKFKLVVPNELRGRVMKDALCTPYSGHLGIEETYDRILRITTLVTSCENARSVKNIKLCKRV